MAVVHVEFDIDGDVYPELYAALAALRQPRLRDERMRQLAAMGLAWEAVRLRGPAVTAIPALAIDATLPVPAMERAAPPARSASRASSKSPARKAGSRAGPSDPGHLLPVLVDIVSKEPDQAPAADALLAEDGPNPPVDPMPVSAASRGAGSRSRLQRMKDRGLFKND